MNTIIKRIKEENKSIAKDIHEFKLRRKPKDFKVLGDYKSTKGITHNYDRFVKCPWEFYGDIRYLSSEYRCRHIAYCELRGRTREQIEKPDINNPVDERKVSNWKVLWQAELVKYQTEKEQAHG